MDSIAECLAGNIRARRKQLKLTQAELAERIDMSVLTVQQLEASKVWVSRESVGKLAKALECSEIALFQDPDTAPPTAHVTPLEALKIIEKALAGKRSMDLVNSTVNCSPDEIDAIFAAAEAILGRPINRSKVLPVSPPEKKAP